MKAKDLKTGDKIWVTRYWRGNQEPGKLGLAEITLARPDEGKANITFASGALGVLVDGYGGEMFNRIPRLGERVRTVEQYYEKGGARQTRREGIVGVVSWCDSSDGSFCVKPPNYGAPIRVDPALGDTWEILEAPASDTVHGMFTSNPGWAGYAYYAQPRSRNFVIQYDDLPAVDFQRAAQAGPIAELAELAQARAEIKRLEAQAKLDVDLIQKRDKEIANLHYRIGKMRERLVDTARGLRDFADNLVWM